MTQTSHSSLFEKYSQRIGDKNKDNYIPLSPGQRKELKPSYERTLHEIETKSPERGAILSGAASVYAFRHVLRVLGAGRAHMGKNVSARTFAGGRWVGILGGYEFKGKSIELEACINKDGELKIVEWIEGNPEGEE